MVNNFKKNKNIALAITILSIIILSSIFTYLGLNLKEKSINKEILYKKSQIELSYLKQMEHLKQVYSDKVRLFLQDKDIIQSFANKDREDLLSKSKIYFNRLTKEEPHFEIMCFALPNSKAFLRVHKPNMYGDNIGHLADIRTVNKQKREIGSFIISKLGLYYRVSTPVYYEHKYIGLVSFGINIGHVNDYISNKFSSEVAILIDSKKNKNKPWFNRLEEGSIGKYTIISSTNDFIDENSKSIDIVSKTSQLNIDNKLYFIHKDNNILNIDNNPIAKILLFQDISHEKKEYESYLQKSIFITLISLIIVVIILMITFDKLIDTIIFSNETLLNTAEQLEQQSKKIKELNSSLEERIQIEVKRNIENEKKLAQQSKQAALGDMIGNIAHQWRQPLSAISTSASGMQLNSELGLVDNEFIQTFTNTIVKNANYLSKTIDDFRDFVKSDKVFKKFNISDLVKQTLDVVNSSINNHKLRVILDLDYDITITNYGNELQQAIINIFNNAKDALKENISKEEDRFIFITVTKDDKFAYLYIKDTAGGIDEKIIDKIFEPYFTTKHQSQGTGLGLYMTNQIIVDSMNSELYVENLDFQYNNKSYRGVQFTIKLKLNL